MGKYLSFRDKLSKQLDALDEKVNFVMAGLGIFYLVLYALDVASTPPSPIKALLDTASWIIWWVFLLDLLLNAVTAKTFAGFIKSNWLEILALTIPFMRALRSLRVLVALKGLKSLVRTRMAMTGAYIIFLLPTAWFVGAVAVLDAENSAPSSHITNLPDALWWSLVTLTTVGYGDFYPTTFEGKIVASILMLLGIGLVSAVAGIFASWLSGSRK